MKSISISFKLIFLVFLMSGYNSVIAQKTTQSIFEKLDFNQSQLETVKKLHESGNDQQALKTLLELYQKK